VNIKEVNWEKMFWRNRPRIEYLDSCFSGDMGERFTILLETENEIYYNDCFGRWVYANKSEEGTSFKYVRKGKWVE
jgi:hypothetical protein